jgi:hypothetical protein
MRPKKAIGEATANRKRAAKPSALDASIGERDQAQDANHNTADDAIDAGRFDERGILEAVADGRRRVGAGEKPSRVVEELIARYPGRERAIATALAPTHAYGAGKSSKTASEYGRVLLKVIARRRKGLTNDQ